MENIYQMYAPPQHHAVSVNEGGWKLDLDLDLERASASTLWLYDGRIDTSFLPVLNYYSATARVVNIFITFGAAHRETIGQKKYQSWFIKELALYLSYFNGLTALDIAFKVPTTVTNGAYGQVKNIAHFWSLPFQNWNFRILDIGTGKWER
jgi:hypothetical protein